MQTDNRENQRKRKKRQQLGTVVEHESGDDINRNWRTWNALQKLGKKTARVRNWTPLIKDHQLRLMRKSHKVYNKIDLYLDLDRKLKTNADEKKSQGV